MPRERYKKIPGDGRKHRRRSSNIDFRSAKDSAEGLQAKICKRDGLKKKKKEEEECEACIERALV